MSLAVQHFEPRIDGSFTDQLVIGLIVLSTDTLTESEVRKMAPSEGVVFSATRIKAQNPITIENLAAHAHEIADAAALFDPPGSVGVFAYACTSGSAIISQTRLEEQLHLTAEHAKLTSPMTGALKAFDLLDIERIALLTPYPDDVTAFMTDCLERTGRSVVSSGSFHMINDFEIMGITPESIIDAASAVDTAEAQALFIPCTGLRTSTIIEPLEQKLGKPVITAHQAMLWDALRLGGYSESISGFGMLLTR